MALVTGKRVLITISISAAQWEAFDDWLMEQETPDGVDATIVSYEEVDEPSP